MSGIWVDSMYTVFRNQQRTKRLCSSNAIQRWYVCMNDNHMKGEEDGK
jgi:hypothetical protein